MSASYDLIVVGGGPGGYVAAIRAAQLGLKTAVVERTHLGGICLNWGCIPTKALLRSAEVYHQMMHASAYGLSAEKAGFNITEVVARSRAISRQLNGGVGYLLKKNKVDVIWGEASLASAGEVLVREAAGEVPKGALGAGRYQAQHIIIATGARPRVIEGVEPDKKLIWTYFEAMVPPQMPQSLVIIGSGAIGVEFASFYRTMGADVTLFEALPTILPNEDAEIAALARKRFEAQGIRIGTGTKVQRVEKLADSVRVHVLDDKGAAHEIEAERLISAVGVVGNIEGLGLEALGVKTERGCIVADGFGRTSVKGVYAIGDVAGPPMLAHKAEHEGVICVEAIVGDATHSLDKNKIPGCTYCAPQIASVGLTEAKAKAAGLEIKVGRFPFKANGKAIALGEPEGLVKTIFDAKTGALLGAHMIGAEVTEMIGTFVLALNLECTEEELMRTVFPHPTLSEMLHESTLDAYGRAIHI